jgi:hypothetical protein
MIVALASDHPENLEGSEGLPIYNLDDVNAIADFVIAHTELPGKT